MLSAMTEGSLASSPMILSAGGHDEHPCEVNNSTTARGSAAWAGRMMATIAQTPSAPDHRENRLYAISAVILRTRETPAPLPSPFNYLVNFRDPKNARKRPFIGRLPLRRHSLRSEAAVKIT